MGVRSSYQGCLMVGASSAYPSYVENTKPKVDSGIEGRRWFRRTAGSISSTLG
jgi:hypothetical protein